MLAKNDELWKEFQYCWRFLRSWAGQTPFADDIITFMKNYDDDDPMAIVEAFKLERPRIQV
jgi:hypothetical protein